MGSHKEITMKIVLFLKQILIAIIGSAGYDSHSKDRYERMRDFEAEIEKRRNERH